MSPNFQERVATHSTIMSADFPNIDRPTPNLEFGWPQLPAPLVAWIPDRFEHDGVAQRCRQVGLPSIGPCEPLIRASRAWLPSTKPFSVASMLGLAVCATLVILARSSSRTTFREPWQGSSFNFEFRQSASHVLRETLQPGRKVEGPDAGTFEGNSPFLPGRVTRCAIEPSRHDALRRCVSNLRGQQYGPLLQRDSTSVKYL